MINHCQRTCNSHFYITLVPTKMKSATAYMPCCTTQTINPQILNSAFYSELVPLIRW